jgi:polyhydroxybutyrate depolymerase
MRRFLRFVRFFLVSLVVLVFAGAVLFWYFLYTADPTPPTLNGVATRGSIKVGGIKRSYRTYVPKSIKPGAPVLLVLHGSGQNGAQIGMETGYGFERLADLHGYAVVYPNAITFDWNDCSKVGDFSINGVAVDDVGFLNALVDKLVVEFGSDRQRVFATGVSSGGFMALRLALEAPSRYRAVAAVSAGVQTPANFKCSPVAGVTSVMLMNGTRDPLVPFDGGEVNLLGLFYKNGEVRPARAAAQFLADLGHIAGKPALLADGAGVTRSLWRNDGMAEVELVVIDGGGHGMPQPWWRRPRLVGPSPMAPNGPELIWAFFARQRR